MHMNRRELLRTMALGALAAAVPTLGRGAEETVPETKPAPFAGPFPRRGIHVFAGGAQNMPNLERLVGEIAPALALNWVILEINGGFQYVSHPECADENPLTKDHAKKLTALAGDKGITLVPMFNSLGHQSWHADTGALLRAHPEFNEAPDMDPNARGFYCMSWCPNHPDLNEVVFDLFDELIDAFQAKAFHVGMDEVFILGECPRCKGTANEKLFAKAVNDLHGHLVGTRKVEMQMWGDRLLDGEATGYGSWEASANDTWKAIDLVPKDIVMCDWHYGNDNPDFPSVRFFQDKGLRVWPAGWNNAEAVQRFIEVSREQYGPLMVGYLCTTWMDIAPVLDGLSGKELPPPPPPPEGRRRRRRGPAELVYAIKVGAALANAQPAPPPPPPPPAPAEPAPPAATPPAAPAPAAP
jgi:hypothetical protein